MTKLSFEEVGYLCEMPSNVREAKNFVEYYMGARCPVYEPQCPVCEAWGSIDTLTRLVDEFTKENENKL